MANWSKEDTLVVSDIHIGSSESKVKRLYLFLDEVLNNPPKRVVVAGDVFELWSTSFKKMGRWEYKVIRKFIELSQNGIKTVYIPGNHDRAFRGFKKISFGKIKIRNEYTVKRGGKKYLILHGDEFDSFTRNHIILSLLLDKLYAGMVKTGRFFKRLFGYNFSLSARKSSEKYTKAVADIRKAAIVYAKSQGVDGIIIGHTHWPEVIKEDDIIFANAGDWIDDCSYVVIGDDVKLGYYKK